MSAVLKPSCRVRPMCEDDLDDVLAIEEATYQFPWTRGIFRDCLHVGYCCWVYVENGTIKAYAVMSIGAGEAHLLTIVVHPQCRGQGLGKMLVSHVLNMASSHGAETVLLEVRPSNNAAIQLYQQLGFNEVGIRPNYYPAPNGREDALIMALTLPANHS
jgi:ribosomal-protein-alanine N-acetyltransferase